MGLPAVATWFSFTSLVLAIHDDAPSAAQAATAAEVARRAPETTGAAWAAVFDAWYAVVRHDPTSAIAHADRGATLARRFGVDSALPHLQIAHGWGIALTESPPVGLARLRDARLAASRGPSATHLAGAVLEADILIALERHAEARDLLDSTIARPSALGERLWLAEVHRCRARSTPTDAVADNHLRVGALASAAWSGARLFARLARADLDALAH